MTLFALLALGFFLGMRHATDSDHVIAVTTIVSRARSARSALWIGALWGLGHTATILSVGGAIVLFGWIIPPRLGLSMEMSVAVMLIVLGAMNLSGAGSSIGHQHLRLRGPLRPLVIGVVHGLAGSAAIALLVLATIKTASVALVYLAIFGLGTIAGMMLVTLAMSLPVAVLAARFSNLERLMGRVAGVVSIAFGLFLAYRIGVTSGLLLGTPSWTPH
jgi:high-affinity nickel-transport protein